MKPTLRSENARLKREVRRLKREQFVAEYWGFPKAVADAARRGQHAADSQPA